ncbi:MAG TPA: hypothetical protein VJ816_12900 [Gemmatimonadales bacterium]|nr:hypothetical protein [Gemmatimonadales bacterium]
MNWWLAGLIGGVVGWFADYFLWGKVFTKGMENQVTPLPAGQTMNMGPMMVKSFLLAAAFGLIFSYLYGRFSPSLWVMGGGPLAGMEFATVLWLPTIALSTVGTGVWYDRARPLMMATFWAWLIRMNIVGLVVGLLMR